MAPKALARSTAPTRASRGRTPRGALFLAVALASLYGATDEFHQSLVPGRDADVVDWVADTLGAAIGAALATAAIRALRRPRGAG